MATHTDPSVRHEAVLLIAARDSNPNGDPDAGNMPRQDPETEQGLMSDGSIKRKARDYVLLTRAGKEGLAIYHQSETALNALQRQAYESLDLSTKGKKGNANRETQTIAQEFMARTYFDIRMFGAVMTTGDHKTGQIQGPVQVSWARSIDPILPVQAGITRVSITREQDFENKRTEMGSRWVVPFGLYRASVTYNPFLAKASQVTEADLALLWEAFVHSWEFTRSAARPDVSCAGLYVFSHSSALGNASARRVLNCLEVVRRRDVEFPRDRDDYEYRVRKADLPQGVTVESLHETVPEQG